LTTKPAKIEKKTVSKAPTPVKPVHGGQIVPAKSLDDPNISPEDWIILRNKAKGHR
jgi:hypothetical protein